MTEFMQSVEKVLNYTLFSINQTPVTLISLFIFVLVLLAFAILARIIGKVILRRFFSRLQVEEGISYSLIRITQYVSKAEIVSLCRMPLSLHRCMRWPVCTARDRNILPLLSSRPGRCSLCAAFPQMKTGGIFLSRKTRMIHAGYSVI